MWGDDNPQEKKAGPIVPSVIGGSQIAVRREPAPTEVLTRSAEERRVRIALLDDHEVLLDSMASWIRNNATDFDVVLSATTWLQMVHSPSFPTDLVLLDVQLKEPVSIEARVRTCRAAGAKVIVLTGLDTADLRERSLRAGASAFVSKSQPLHEVLSIARDLMGAAARPEFESWRPLPAAAIAVEKPHLSVGEEEALRLYASGRSTNEVAAEMHVQYETAKTYLRRVREKYAKANRPASRKSDLMRRAAEDGFLE